MALTTGRLAKGAGVGISTLRYYERRGLLSRPGRTVAGYRQYPEDEILRVRFIRRAQGLGFALEEIRGLLALRVRGGKRCGEVALAAHATRERLRERHRELLQMERALSRMLRACRQGRAMDACPILAAIEPGVDP